jgi:hypothetical protein
MSTRLAQVEQRLAELQVQTKSDVDGQIEKIRALSNTWARELEQQVRESGAKIRNEINRQIDEIRTTSTIRDLELRAEFDFRISQGVMVSERRIKEDTKQTIPTGVGRCSSFSSSTSRWVL